MKITKVIAKIIVSFLPCKFYTKKINELSKRYKYDESKNVGCLVWGYGPQEAMDKEKAEKYINLKFENIEVCGLESYDSYLTNLYKDYMELPPIEKRADHNIKVWKNE